MKNVLNCYDVNIINKLSSLIKKHVKNEEVVFLCVGNDMCIQDSLGAFVGSFLDESNISQRVYGSLKKPVNANNLHIYKDLIKVENPNSKILVIDAMISNKYNVGDVIVEDRGIYPGSASLKYMEITGDMSISCVVGNLGVDYHSYIRIGEIYKYAKLIALSIKNANINYSIIGNLNVSPTLFPN